jgi:hypothetical protein
MSIDSEIAMVYGCFKIRVIYIVVPDRHYADYLGRGFSGDILEKGGSSPLSLDNYNFF